MDRKVRIRKCKFNMKFIYRCFWFFYGLSHIDHEQDFHSFLQEADNLTQQVLGENNTNSSIELAEYLKESFGMSELRDF